VGVHKMVSGSSSGGGRTLVGFSLRRFLIRPLSDVVWAWESMSAEITDKRPVTRSRAEQRPNHPSDSFRWRASKIRPMRFNSRNRPSTAADDCPL
jgi:hypothetical protein